MKIFKIFNIGLQFDNNLYTDDKNIVHRNNRTEIKSVSEIENLKEEK